MKTCSFKCRKPWGLALFLMFLASISTAQQPRPIGGVQEHRLGAPFKPLYADEVKPEIESFVGDVGKVAASVEKVKVDKDAPKDQIERQIDGALSLARHRADLTALRDRFSLCMAAMEHHCAERMESRAATDSEKKSMTDGMDDCTKILAQLDNLHHNTSKLITATRKTYLLNAWDRHQAMMTELKSMTEQCSMMFNKMRDASETPAHGSDAAAHKHSAPNAAATSDISSDRSAYACPMHPEVSSSQPGRCPKCGMHLVKKS